MAMLMSALLFTACGATPVSVKILDMGETIMAEGTDDMTVAELLEKAEIVLGDKDQTEPEPQTKWSESGASEITVKRYAKVTVVNGEEEKSVELVGGTVEDAVKEAGYSFDDGIEADVDKNTYLKDGMTITLSKAVKVTLTVDGNTKDYTTKAETVKAFLDENKITLGEDDEVSVKTDSKIKDGLKITVTRVEYKEEKTTEDIAYETEVKSDDTLASGTTNTIQSGVNGKKEITYKVKYVDGKEDSREKVSEEITKEPVNEIIAQGTKVETKVETATQAPAQNSQSSQSAQSAPAATSGRTVVSKQKVLDCDGSGHGYYIITYSDGTEEYEDF